MAMMTPMTASTTMTPPSHSLLNNDLPLILLMNKQGQESRPSKEENLHNAQREGRLEHSAGLIHLQRERVTRALAILAERAERDPDHAGVPVGAVSVGDEAELVDGGDEGADEAEVDEGDEERGAFCCGEAEERVDAPEDGDYADDEQD